MSSQKLRLPESTRRSLEQYRNRVRFIRIAEGLLAGLMGLVLSYLAVFFLDRLFDTSAALRSCLLAVGSAGLGVLFPWKCHRWIWGTRRLEQVAVLLKQKFPALGDQLLGIVELVHNDNNVHGNSAGASVRLAQAAIDQVDSVVREKDFSDAVPRPRHRFWSLTLAVPLAMAILALAVVPSAGWNAMQRWLMPWRHVERYTFAQIDHFPNRMVIPHGEEFSLEARLSASTRWSPTAATAKFRSQPPVRAANQQQAYQFKLPPQTESGRLDVRIGDLTKDIAVEVAARPELNGMSALIQLPDYLQYQKPVSTDVRGGVISVVKGSIASFNAEVSRALSAATIEDQPAAVVENRIQSTAMTIDSPKVLAFRWRDQLGLTAREAFNLKINAVEDGEPAITFRQEDPQQVVLTTDVITFELQSRDDFGVSRIGLDWTGVAHPVHNPDPQNGHKVVAAGAPEMKSVSAKATLCAATDNLAAQTLEVRAYVEDYKPDRGRIYSPAYVLHVMTPEQHSVWMMEQLRRWASLADDVYEEEMRLHDKNRQIRQMDPEQLNAPETRREIEQQAAAEKTNAERLTAITNNGDLLLKQALRNKEMMVGHLETWAGALQKLRRIGESRMPSVSDLLSQSAKAPGKKSAGSQSTANSSPQAGNNKGSQTGNPGEQKKSSTEPPAVPKLADTESGFNPQNPADNSQQTSKSGSAKFGLPSTVLQGGPPADKKAAPSNAAEEKVEQAIEEQTTLLAEFQKVREDLQEIMDDLESSTFVKRLKAASRDQLEVASALNRTLYDGFGVTEKDLASTQKEQVTRIAVREQGQSQKVRTIQDDLEAYYDRRKEEKFGRILKEMDEYEIVSKLHDLGDRVKTNRSGEAIAKAEFWGDTLDRWAEELVSASKCGQCKGGKGHSLPPSIVLEVMRILEGEMDLREETRALEQVRPVIESVEYQDKAEAQSEAQRVLLNRVASVVTDIRALPLGDSRFGKEIKLLSAAGDAMTDAQNILKRPDTGREAIAAETEVIELLLQTKRANPKSGGGGGGSSAGGGGEGDTDEVALELYGPGSDPNARIEAREVRQSTGTTNDQTPQNFAMELMHSSMLWKAENSIVVVRSAYKTDDVKKAAVHFPSSEISTRDIRRALMRGRP